MTRTLRQNVSLVQKSSRTSIERSFFAECPYLTPSSVRHSLSENAPRHHCRLLYSNDRLLLMKCTLLNNSLFLESSSSSCTLATCCICSIECGHYPNSRHRGVWSPSHRTLWSVAILFLCPYLCAIKRQWRILMVINRLSGPMRKRRKKLR
jgi:hypothetical protein